MTADELAQKTEEDLAWLRAQSAAHFTVAEILWVQHVSTRIRWGTSDESEERLRAEVLKLRSAVVTRIARLT